MKKFRKLLALLLALAIVFSLAACSTSNEDDDEEDDKGSSNVEKDDKDEKDDEEEKLSDEEMIVGEWLCRFDLGEVMNEMLAEEIDDTSLAVDSELYMNLSLEFEDDKATLRMELDEDSLEDYMKALCDAMVDYMFEMAEEQGMSKEDFEQGIQAAYGMSVDKYIEDMMGELMESSFDEMSYESESWYYKVDDKKGRIYMAEYEDDLADSEEYMEYTIKGEKMTIEKLVDETGEMETLDLEELDIDLPWEFEKQ